MTTAQYIGVILGIVTILALIVYIAYLQGVLTNQTQVIQDLAFENKSLKQTNTGLRTTIGNLVDAKQIAELETWGNDAAASDPGYAEAFRLDKP